MFFTRRDFVKTCAYTGALVQTGSLFSRNPEAAEGPKMSIARFSSPSEDPAKIKEEAEKLTRAAIEALGGMSRFIVKGDIVWVKPNSSWERTPEQAANTNPNVVAAVVKMCLESGAKTVLVGDRTCSGAQQSYARSGIQKSAAEAGAKVVFLDDNKYKKYALNGKVLKEWEIYKDIEDATKLINIPIAKHHQLTEVSLSMKNLMGIIGGNREQYHSDLANTLPDLAAFVKPDLVIVDGIRVLMKNGPTGGNLADVKRRDVIAAGIDQVALDAFGTTLLDKKPEDITHIVEAAKRNMGTIDYKSLNPKEVNV